MATPSKFSHRVTGARPKRVKKPPTVADLADAYEAILRATVVYTDIQVGVAFGVMTPELRRVVKAVMKGRRITLAIRASLPPSRDPLEWQREASVMVAKRAGS